VWIRWAAASILCSMAVGSSAAFCATADSDSATDELWLSASLNGQQSDDVALFLRTSAGRLLAPATQLEAWRLPAPAQAAVSHEGEQYVPLDALPGVSYSIDEEKQSLILTAPARLFEPVTLNIAGNNPASTPPPPPTGGFLNYDIVAADSDSHATLSGLLEASIFGPAGAGVTEFLVRHHEQGQGTRATRLNSTWEIDRPETINTLRLGDSITGSSAWGGAVRFGGIQWASNYTTRPGLITMPLPSIAGEAALPSSVSLYVDDMLRMQNSVPGGPFRIDNVPVITGDGNVRLVVRDLLGREQVISEPYYASPELLRAGLQEYSLEVGFVRENFGIAANDYGAPLVVATDRVGLTDQFTGEAHVEALKDRQAVGLSVSVLLSALGVLDASVAGSRSRKGQGELLRLGYQHSGRWLSLGGSVEYASRTFSRLGFLPDQLTPALTSQMFVSVGLGHLGSLSVNRTRQTYYRGPSVDIMSVRDSINVGWLGYLSLSINRTVAGNADTTVTLGLSHPINARTGLTSNTSFDSGGGTLTEIGLQRNLPAGPGLGYRLIADAGAMHAVDGTLALQGDVGTYTAQVRQQSGSSLAEISATGGIAMLAGHFFPTREIDDSFAAVQVGQESGVRIYRENQLVGETNAQGYLLVPGLRAYQNNDIRIEQADLPLDVVVDTLQAQAVPYFRSAVVVRFPIEHPQGALLSVRLENGAPLSAGALVRLTGQQDEFPVGLNGEVYVTGLADRNELRAEWTGGGSCRFTVTYTPTADPLPRLGPYVCRSEP
jgi:outer membrane usher protein